jgi:TetR/AcrR family transcriptional regulator
MPRPARVSPDRILAAAATEFAARGFAGARVDRIARRAGVNKAMLYYHFRSKQALYRTLLRQMFSEAADRLHAIAADAAPSADKVDRVIAGIAAFIAEHDFFPAIMLREVAEGGAHLDRETLTAMASLPLAIGAIVQEGAATGSFRTVHPLFAYFTMVAPIMFFLAGAPIRRELAALQLMNVGAMEPDEFVRHVQGFVRRALAPDAPVKNDARLNQ